MSPVHLGALLGLVDVAVTVLGGGIRNRMSKKIINIYFFPMLTSKEFIRKCLNILNVSCSKNIPMKICNRVRQNGTSVTPRYEVRGKMIHSIYEDTW